VDAVGGTSFAGDKMALKGMVAAAADATDKTAAMSADATAKRFIQPPLDLHVTDLPREGGNQRIPYGTFPENTIGTQRISMSALTNKIA